MALPRGAVGWSAVCAAFLDLLLNEGNIRVEDTLPFYPLNSLNRICKSLDEV